MRWGLLSLILIATAGMADDGKVIEKTGDIEQIQKLYASWRDAVENSNIDGYVNVLHEDVRLLPPGAPAIQGRVNYARFLEPVFLAASYKIDIEQMQVIEVVGDLAVAEYDYRIHLHRKDPDIGITEPGALTQDSTSARYFDVLRKTKNGHWKVWRHSWQAK